MVRDTWCSLPSGQFSFRSQQDSSSGRTAERKHYRTTTSSYQHSHSSLHPAVVPQTPAGTQNQIARSTVTVSYKVNLPVHHLGDNRFQIEWKNRQSYFHAALPADPQVSPGEKAGHSVPRQVVDPALLSQLGHNGVDPGETSPTLSPLGQCFWVLVPWDLETNMLHSK